MLFYIRPPAPTPPALPKKNGDAIKKENDDEKENNPFKVNNCILDAYLFVFRQF